MISIKTFFKVKDDAFYKIGKADGIAEGIAEEKAEIAIRLKDLGCNTESISKALNIPVHEAEKLINPEP
jgi:hypothetical protein